MNSQKSIHTPLLIAQNLAAGYPGCPRVFQGISLEITSGSRLGILGQSGCGKSTLLRTLADLHPPAQGEIERNYTGQQLGFLPQHFGLFPWFRIWENTALPLQLRGVGKRDRREAAFQALAVLGLGGLEQRYPKEVSGGQRQRAALARTIASKNQLLLLDEPFSNLDAMTRESLQEQLFILLNREQMGCVLVTHSIEEAAFLCEKIYIMGSSGLKPVEINPLRPDTPPDRQGKTFYTRCIAIRQALEHQ